MYLKVFKFSRSCTKILTYIFHRSNRSNLNFRALYLPYFKREQNCVNYFNHPRNIFNKFLFDFWKISAYTQLENTYPCADYKPGEDDLQNFDMIRKFKLDVNLDGYPGVTRVRGSNRMQTAYRIDSTANLRMPTM